MTGDVKRAREEAAVDRDPRVREREQRHDHVARPRVVELLQPLVRRDRGLEPDLRAERASSGVGCSRNSRKRSVARSRSTRAAGYAYVSRPITRPTMTGSMPDLKTATHIAAPSTAYDEPPTDAELPHARARRRGSRPRPRAARQRGSRCRRSRSRRSATTSSTTTDRQHERAQARRRSAARRARASRARTRCRSTSPRPSRAPTEWPALNAR